MPLERRKEIGHLFHSQRSTFGFASLFIGIYLSDSCSEGHNSRPIQTDILRSQITDLIYISYFSFQHFFLLKCSSDKKGFYSILMKFSVVPSCLIIASEILYYSPLSVS